MKLKSLNSKSITSTTESREIASGPPKKLVLQLRDRYELQNFIETGTSDGATSAWAASHFDSVITAEYCRQVYDRTVTRHGHIQNIDFVFGDSRSILEDIVPKLTRPAIFWLDSHWCGPSASSYGEDDQCSLIGEIRPVNKSEYTHFIIIDDARLFCAPPPRPNKIEAWPSIDEVIEVIKDGIHDYYIVVVEDLIIAVPKYAKGFVANYYQEVNSRAWEEHGKYLKRGSRSIGEGLKLINLGLRLRYRWFRHLLSSFIRVGRV